MGLTAALKLTDVSLERPTGSHCACGQKLEWIINIILQVNTFPPVLSLYAKHR